jgi:flagellar biosynthetic protein FliR
MALLPAFGERMIPSRIRLVLALALTALVAPAVAPAFQGTRVGLQLLLTETAIGLAFGMALRLMVLALQIAGSVAAQSTSLAQVFGNSSVEPQPAIGHVLMMGGLALATLAGLHVKIVAALVGTYALFPPGGIPLSPDMAAWGIARVARVFSLGFTLAAPFVITAMLYNLALGVINKAMPQLMVALVGAPAITGAGLALLALTAPVVLQVWVEILDGVIADPFGAW